MFSEPKVADNTEMETKSLGPDSREFKGLEDLGRNHLRDRSLLQATLELYARGARFVTRPTIESILTIAVNYPGVPEIIVKFINTCEQDTESPVLTMLDMKPSYSKLRALVHSAKVAYNYYYLADGLLDLSLGYSIEFRACLLDVIKKALEFLNGRVETSDYHLKAVFTELQKLFNLSDEEVKWLYLLQLANETGSPLQDSIHPGQSYTHTNIASFLDISPAQLSEMKEGKLLRMGLIHKDSNGHISTGSLVTDIVTKGIKACHELFFEIPVKEKLPLSCHLVDQKSTDYIKCLLNSEKNEAPVHILVWGGPGTGKSSYIKGLIQSLKWEPLIIKHGAMAGDKNGKTESSIYASIEVALHAPRMKKSVCVVDDADSILGTTKGFLESGETRNRVWLHNLLERPNTKVVWIVNDTRFIDDSIKRRFSYSLYFPPLQIEQKVQVWKNILKRYKAKRYMPDSEIIHWVKRYDVSVGVINLCVKMVMLGNIKNKADFLSHLEMSMESYKSLSKNTNRFTKIQRGSDHFIDSIGTSVEVSEIIADLVEFDNYLKAANRKETLPIRNRSLLFYGVPGAGKSELAKYISEKLNKPLIRKLASDILSMWVGGTEQNIRDAYQEAEIKDGVLFIDEADSLLFDRGGAQRSWEVTQVNELLARMEDFVGIQIFATNRMKDLDSASVRRFSHKIKFDYLQSDQVLRFYNQFFKQELSIDNTQKILNLQNLVPSDFKAVQDRLFFKKGVTEANIIEELTAESQNKTKHSGKKNIGF